MITFRASYSGNCIREIVSIALHPEPEVFDPFLHAGHTLQTTVIKFLLDNNINVLTNRFTDELEGKYVHEGRWRLVGHLDGILGVPWGILEVKAIKDESFQKLEATNDWRGIYGQYIPQSQTYMGFKEYRDNASNTKLSGPMERTSFVFYNRNTGHILSPLGIEHTKHTQRKDLTEYRSPNIFQEIIDKHEVAYEYVQKEEIPSECDYPGYCFFCKRFNSASNGTGTTKVVSGGDYKTLAEMVRTYRRMKKDQKKMSILGDTIKEVLDSMGVETLRLTYKGKRGMNIKRWEFK
ncbi:MAG: hypothetical protein ACXABY_24665 [Candidatus Thorarchaeota archaeon]|jgi:hypothetical protein